jgi:hypothetical protein
MKVYGCYPDVDKYRQLVDLESEEVSEERFEELSFDGIEKADNWNPPFLKWIVEDEPEEIPDIAYWCPGTLVLSARATEVLRPIFSDVAEFLPVPVEGDEGWSALNVTNMQDAIDKVNSRYKIRSDGTVGRLLEMAIDKSKITNGVLFRIAGRHMYLYSSDVPGSFKEIVEKNDLTGLEFDEV